MMTSDVPGPCVLKNPFTRSSRNVLSLVTGRPVGEWEEGGWKEGGWEKGGWEEGGWEWRRWEREGGRKKWKRTHNSITKPIHIIQATLTPSQGFIRLTFCCEFVLPPCD